MYLIDKAQNNISQLEKKSFSELKFKERDHLQEWIAKNPTCLGEELLIIQKEFSGFNETNERLDLLALDKQGNLVIIENKLDDSGRDVTWQALKYASYCASLSKQEIIKIYQAYLGTSQNAEENLSEFFEGKDLEEITLNQGATSQRLILVAANFRKEVTSSVLWLMNFKIRIQCFKVTPYALNEQLFLNVEQILPTKDTEEFAISMASKAQEEVQVQETLKNRHHVRLAFWEAYITESNKHNQLFANISPSKDNWIGIGIGMSGIGLNLVASKNLCRSEIYINHVGNKELNKKLFDFLFNLKNEIEQAIGETLSWERMDDKVSCRIRHQLDNVDIYENDNWEKMITFLVDSAQRMEQAFRQPVKKLNNYRKTLK
ncbi:MAG: DUF4268 domain-containing protein [Marinilabiliaceae bacterium]|nr:DUF4268 domain-containing protein [Marinilabiliaceae bacterium]